MLNFNSLMILKKRCNEICGHGDGTDIRCVNACMDDCDRACEICKTQPTCVYYTPPKQRGPKDVRKGLKGNGKGKGEKLTY